MVIRREGRAQEAIRRQSSGEEAVDGSRSWNKVQRVARTELALEGNRKILDARQRTMGLHCTDWQVAKSGEGAQRCTGTAAFANKVPSCGTLDAKRQTQGVSGREKVCEREEGDASSRTRIVVKKKHASMWRDRDGRRSETGDALPCGLSWPGKAGAGAARAPADGPPTMQLQLSRALATKLTQPSGQLTGKSPSGGQLK